MPYKILNCIFGQFVRFLPHHFSLEIRNLPTFMYFDTSSVTYGTLIVMPSHVTNEPKISEIQTLFPHMQKLQFFSERYLLGNKSIITPSVDIRIRQWRFSQRVAISLIKLYGMYRHCSFDIERTKADFILRLREDSFFYGLPARLNTIISTHKKCDLIYNDCQVWNGVNDRWQLISYRIGIQYLRHEVVYLNSVTTRNTEEYEKKVATMFQLATCPVSTSKIRQLIARKVNESHLCIRRKELSCIHCATPTSSLLSCEDKHTYHKKDLENIC